MNAFKLNELSKYFNIVDVNDGTGHYVKTIVFSGVNIQLVNGLNATESDNSAGNIIVGYNEQTNPSGLRTGSHNIALGQNNQYTEYAGIVGGERNAIKSPFSSIIGGTDNLTNVNNGEGGIIIGAQNSETQGNHGVIVGGLSHLTSWENDGGVIVGGEGNVVRFDNSVIVGGRTNQADAMNSVVVGGVGNFISHTDAIESVIIGGESNVINEDAPWSVVGGGYNRGVSGIHDFRAGSILEDD
jgi:hypothetical protein